MNGKAHITATGNVTGWVDGRILGLVLTGGSAAAVLTLREGGSGGTTILVVKAAIDTSVVVPLRCTFAGQLHATLTGTGATATIWG